MLLTHLKALPFTKFVLIEDSLATRGSQFLGYLVKEHEKHSNYRVYYFVFEQIINTVQCPKCEIYDYSSDTRNWLKSQNQGFESILEGITGNSVVIIDSLAHILYRFGLSETYRILHQLKAKSNILQIVTLLHLDLLDDKDTIRTYFCHLATLNLELSPNRVAYTFKKSPRKIINAVEEYDFRDGSVVCQVIKKPDPEVVEKKLEEVLPDELTTFKIGLSDKDKASRGKLILPYLPREETEESKIHYELDDVDDWDEEDPDDDLDI